MVRACCETGMEMRSKKGLVDALRRNPAALINYFFSNPCIISTSF